MSFPFFVARRYLFAKKTYNIINLISGISVFGVTIGTMALIIVLSVFNGFEDIVVRLFNAFNADLLIQPASGKFFTESQLPVDKIVHLQSVQSWSGILEENALLKYDARQSLVTLKGVETNYGLQSGLDSMIVEGDFSLGNEAVPKAVMGYGVAYTLDIQLKDLSRSIEVFFPQKMSTSLMSQQNAFNILQMMPSGYFSVQQDFDTRYCFVPLSFMRKLLASPDKLSAFEIRLQPGAKISKVQADIDEICGDQFTVKNRFQQEEALYKIMKSEKWAIILILGFIMVIATFNVIGSLTMLILDKKKDISVLWSLGAPESQIRRIFFLEGFMICLFGAVAGLILGGFVCWLQEQFGLIKLSAEQGAFLIQYYPVKMKLSDFLFVFLLVLSIGILATWLPSHRISKKYLEKRALTG